MSNRTMCFVRGGNGGGVEEADCGGFTVQPARHAHSKRRIGA
ncbi:hypothetical protein P4H66_22310 [Paenibacillus dokdonensis]|uniref:Uncharacterized protein n=1 Tax=Paenibacillus dokdonensis TaxID=2567944 RepID=A0ABU6GS13_9BACL|nr:hypothetical protein [Paenibacillus dokdonensis]MEC0242550.1 hypothetical protein [Paenibacillus dokdonensis]